MCGCLGGAAVKPMRPKCPMTSLVAGDPHSHPGGPQDNIIINLAGTQLWLCGCRRGADPGTREESTAVQDSKPPDLSVEQKRYLLEVLDKLTLR